MGFIAIFVYFYTSFHYQSQVFRLINTAHNNKQNAIFLNYSSCIHHWETLIWTCLIKMKNGGKIRYNCIISADYFSQKHQKNKFNKIQKIGKYLLCFTQIIIWISWQLQQMTNKDLIQLVELLDFSHPNNIKKAQQTLISNKDYFIHILTKLLLTTSIRQIPQESLKKAKLCSSIALNALFQIGSEEISGMEQLQIFWKIFFNWDIDMAIKINLQRSFTSLVSSWQFHHQMMFERGIQAMVGCLFDYAEEQIQEESRCIILKEGKRLYVQFKPNPNIQNILLSLLFLCRNCVSTIRRKEHKQQYFQRIVKTIGTLFRIVRLLANNDQITLAKFELIYWTFECCESMKAQRYQKIKLLEQFYTTIGMDEMIADIFKKDSILHKKDHQSLCWICTNLSQQLFLRQKIIAAETYIKFMEQLSNSNQINLLLQKQQNLKSLLFTISCYTCLPQQQKSALKQCFVSLLIEIYQSYFEKFPNTFQSLHQQSLNLIVFPLIKINIEYLAQFENKPSEYLDLLYDCWKHQRQNNTLVKAVKILRLITNNSNYLYNQIMLIVRSLLNDHPFQSKLSIRSQFLPNLHTSWILLIAICPSLDSDQASKQQIISIIQNTDQTNLSDLSITLITFFLKIITIKSDQCKQTNALLNKYMVQGLNRKDQFLESFMVQLKIETIQVSLSWQFFEFIYIKLLDRRQGILNNKNWIILQKSLQYHFQSFNLHHLNIILASAQQTLSAEIKIHGIKDRTLILKICSLVRIIITHCSLQKLNELTHIIIDIFGKYPQVAALNFGEQMICAINQFFKKQQMFISAYDPVLRIVIGAYKQSVQSHFTCTQILNLVINLPSQSLQKRCLLILKALVVKINQYVGSSQQIQQLYADLVTLEYILHCYQFQSNILLKVVSLVVQISKRIDQSLIQIRAMNILLASRTYIYSQHFSWSFVLQICQQKRLSEYEQRLTLQNIRRFIDNNKISRNWIDYANILKILYEIHKYTLEHNLSNQFLVQQNYGEFNAKMLQLSPFELANLNINTQIQLIFEEILKRKRFFYPSIEQKLAPSVANYFVGLIKKMEVEYEKQKQKCIYVRYDHI